MGHGIQRIFGVSSQLKGRAQSRIPVGAALLFLCASAALAANSIGYISDVEPSDIKI